MMLGLVVATTPLWMAAAAQQAGGPTGPAPPFSFNMDQTVPCPPGSADYSIAAPLADPAAAPLQGALAPVPGMLKAKLAELGCPGVAVIVTQGGRVVYQSYAGSARLQTQAPLVRSAARSTALLHCACSRTPQLLPALPCCAYLYHCVARRTLRRKMTR